MCQGHHGKPGRYWSSPQSTTLCALPQEPASTHALFTGRLPTAPLFIPAALQPTKGTCLPWVRCQDCDAQCVAWTAYSPGQIFLFLSVPSQKHRCQPDPFPSLPIWFHVSLFYSLGCRVSQFSVITILRVDVFDVFVAGTTSSSSVILINSPLHLCF